MTMKEEKERIKKWNRHMVRVWLATEGYCDGCQGGKGGGEDCDKCDAFNKQFSKVSSTFYSLFPFLCDPYPAVIDNNHSFGGKKFNDGVLFRRGITGVKGVVAFTVGILEIFKDAIANVIPVIQVSVNNLVKIVFHKKK